MRLLSLTLEQFRNYGTLSVEFPENDLHLFLGPNGSGKTNILEAVSLLSLTKSFLGLEEEDLAQWGTEFYRARARARTDGGEDVELEVVGQLSPRRQKACFCNGVRTPTSRMVGRLPVITFLPQDLSLFSGPPADRRQYIDRLLCQVSPDYAQSLTDYQRILKQRNALLKDIAQGRASAAGLDPWDQQLAEQGSVLLALRRELMETFNLTLRDEIRALGETWDDVRMHYETAAGELLPLLAQARERDLLLQSTSVGPHRDDWTMLVDGRPIFSFASRGQQRVAVLALLFLETSYLEVRRGEKPVVLLDDIFSELDADHRRRLLEAFTGHQVLLTATEMPVEQGAFTGSVRTVNGGSILPL